MRFSELGGFQRSGSGWIARCPAHDDHDPSLSIRYTEEGRVLVHCFAGCDQEAVIGALRDQGLWDAGEAMPLRRMAPVRPKTAKRVEENPNREAALDIWRKAQLAAGTLVKTYLRGRSITLEIPISIRYAPGLKHGPTGQSMPAMVACIQGPDGKITGVHRTYLTIDGRAKAPVSTAKMMLGKFAGGAVRFAKAGPKLAIGEGIETCLSVAQECPDLPVWSALSTSGIKAVRLPESVREVIILVDADESGEKAAQGAAQRFIQEGRSVRFARPPSAYKDFNDALRGFSGVDSMEACDG